MDDDARRRAQRLERVFGDVLPDTTGDEQREQPADHDERDQWYRENRPPHHDSPT